MIKRMDTGDKLDSISDRINRRDLLNINNDYNASSSDTDETESSTLEKDPADLSDVTPPISGVAEPSNSSGDGYFRRGSGTNVSRSTGKKTPSSPLANGSHVRSRKSHASRLPRVGSSSSDISDSDITLGGLVKYVSEQDHQRLLRRKSRSEDGTTKEKKKKEKYRLRFGDLSFTGKSTILDSQEFIKSEFYGFYILFWLSTAFAMCNQLVHMYFESYPPFWKWEIVQILERDIFKVGLTDLAMYLTSYFPLFLQILCKRGWISWKRTGWVLQSTYETAFVAVYLWFAHYMQYPWIARVFLVLHSLVFLMKMHSYGYYNGYLWTIFSEGLFSERYFFQLQNNEVELPEGHDLDHTIGILKSSIEFTKYELEYQSQATTNKPEQDDGKYEGIEINYSFAELQERGLIKFPQNISLWNYFEYSMFPTVVYTIQYPRTPKVRWHFVFEKVCGIFGLIFLMVLVAQHNLLPIVKRAGVARKLPVQERGGQYFFILLDMIPPFLMEYLFTFFLIWDAILNALAELTLFADRNFYGPWWSCTDFSEFARLWNKPVHNFLLRHVYHSSISALKVNKIHATLITFIISSVVHELVMYVIFGTLRGYLLLFQMSQIPLVMMTRSKFLRDKKVLGNIICWFGFISGPSIICTLYLVF
ncbi:ARE2 [Candida margitis]|uniref:ARE2 n=1 Tax=Candida margitis TaxID=1775924 RepID=UPI002226164F|nr:ARE2 [Candida margitis]KAI5950510.1 ARE2 [Candida margitis]